MTLVTSCRLPDEPREQVGGLPLTARHHVGVNTQRDVRAGVAEALRHPSRVRRGKPVIADPAWGSSAAVVPRVLRLALDLNLAVRSRSYVPEALHRRGDSHGRAGALKVDDHLAELGDLR